MGSFRLRAVRYCATRQVSWIENKRRPLRLGMGAGRAPITLLGGAHMIRVVLYLNQFFGGIGGEDKADLPARLTEDIHRPGQGYCAPLWAIRRPGGGHRHLR